MPKHKTKAGAAKRLPEVSRKPDAELINDLGGPAQVARLLGYSENGRQRVFNWMTRGIPASVRLEHLDLFGRPSRGAAQSMAASSRAPRNQPLSPVNARRRAGA